MDDNIFGQLDSDYQIVYADPPWSYRDKGNAGERGASHKYETQDMDWIRSLPVSDIAHEDCALFMWVTMPLLDECIEVIGDWGFEYKTAAFTWIKRNKKSNSLFWGMGHWTRSNAELCLLGTRGDISSEASDVHQVVEAPIMEHSRKPAEVRQRIVDLMGDLKRVELFARKPKNQLFDSRGFDGWDVWGRGA